MTDVNGGTVFITGGAQGIGLGIARVFARAGARVALADIAQEPLDAAVAELGRDTRVEGFVLDVRDREAFARVAEEAEQRLGPVTVLVNNAGVTRLVSAIEASYAVWDHVLGINLGGVVNGVQTFLPRMIERGAPGHVVNVASGAGLYAGTDWMYATSKFAVVGMTESLSQRPEVAGAGIGATVVCPGFVRTDIVSNSAAVEIDGRTGFAPQELVDLFDRHGLAPEEVGAQVLQAVREDRLYVVTDRFLEPMLRQRTDAILESLPPETDRDREVRAAFAEMAGKLATKES